MSKLVKNDIELRKKMVLLLKQAGEYGVEKSHLIKELGISSCKLSRMLHLSISLPIAYDSEVDNRLYWIGL